MLEDRQKRESSHVIKMLMSEGLVIKPKSGTGEFFMEKSRQSLATASRLLELEKEESLPSLMWVINASYYSMFFAATALLAGYGKKIDREQGIHRLTYHALVHFFIVEDNKLAKHFIDQYREAIEQAEELLRLGNQGAERLIADFSSEMRKRKIFTYELGEIAERKKAEASLERAKNFVREVESMLREQAG
ncbi:HEPN domain-containing protein [Candidatus Woesearchaeota archaeon]|nr:HEPN domain-containing protein [Candidatus Woesearchaeota archaeon]